MRDRAARAGVHVTPETAPQHTPSLPLAGHVAWITGASRGLGRAAALGLAAAGANVALTARDTGRLHQVEHEVEAIGRKAMVVPGSVADPHRMLQVAEEIVATLGRLDVLVNNAGISPRVTRSEEVIPSDWQEVLEVNLSGPFYCAQAAARVMAVGGSIINVSSIHGSVGKPRLAAYTASKGGIEALTRTLALEWVEREIRVNALAPGYVETDMTAGIQEQNRWRRAVLDSTPMSRLARAEEFVPAIEFLASSASSYMTGAVLTIDGGWTAQ